MTVASLAMLLVTGALALSEASASGGVIYAQVTLGSTPGSISIQTSPAPLPISPTAHAWGWYNDTIASNGWSFLDVESQAKVDSGAQAYAAGYLEGYLTAARTFEFINNTNRGPSTWSPALSDFIHTNLKWIDVQVAENPSDVYGPRCPFLSFL
jgi:hypothetical protein